MKISIERNLFLNSLSHVQNVVEKRNTIPILSNILINSNEDKVILTTTDMDISITEVINSSVIEQGSITTSAHTLYDIVRKLDDGSSIELISNDGNKLSVRSGKSKFSLACLPKDDFPKIDNAVLENEFSISSSELKKIIDKTKFAISSEETRYYLNGMYIHIIDLNSQKKLRGVATDGHRLSKIEIEVPKGAENISGAIIPKKTINEIRKLLDEAEGDVFISLNESKIIFKINNIVLSSKLIDGSFPEYEKVIPQNNDKMISFNTKSLYEAVDRVSTVSSEKSRSVKLSIQKNIVSLSSTSAETGSGAEDIVVEYSGEEFEIGYNAKYLLEIIGQIEGDNVSFVLSDSSSPSIIQDPKDKESLYILMPMRV
ncbi:MAG: DNA polymerase III subunit beta [Alphaproteobacteria bacterium MarineAlpha5_Bin11]|nr:DNA polymerase III subunit beta [Pelagibacteraceae bacterium]PPR45167.1 MAG: DNA polymerase III subunit beta [Alphaproteobacteria bacterium MarineAlpha5_Bin11]PPR52139.1 MAG: DNA polymerase III subunit beta [Alphaproteobacteria bacterium MarineAlpha5_Bin10]|tara:strand:- start:17115 stop:18230 length:1116 start_codon:yes stop_codon:yes gene_type:complete